MFPRHPSSKRSVGLAMASVAGLAVHASGQLYVPTSSVMQHQFSFGSASNFTRVNAKWFNHGWARSCNQWLDQHAAWTTWSPATGTLVQHPDFSPYGADAMLPNGAGSINNGIFSPLSPPFPFNSPASVNIPIALASQDIPGSGTLFFPAGALHQVASASNGFVRGTGETMVMVDPWMPPMATSTLVSGLLETRSAYTENAINAPVERGYGFSFGEVTATALHNPAWHPPVYSGNLFCISANISIPSIPSPPTFQPPPGPWAPPYTARRAYDPIRYSATDIVTGLNVSGVVVSMHIDAGPGTTVDVVGGNMYITGNDASVRIDMSDPRVSPQGTYELDIRNGVVVSSFATGCFSGMLPPPAGSSTPLGFSFPDNYPFTLDLHGFTNNPFELDLSISAGGMEPIAELCCAQIGLQPVDVAACQGTSATLSVGAYGTGPLVYQWRRGDGFGNFWPIVDGLTAGGAVISGANTNVLDISNISPMEVGVYDCLVSDVCATAYSSTATITVSTCSTPCYANCDGSTSSPRLTSNDFLCFINAYSQGDTYANCDGSIATPILTPNDFQCFLMAYANGCS